MSVIRRKRVGSWGWFLCKSFRLGPLRLNVSKSGLGASVGLKGARLGVDAEGHPYVAGGRAGIYFRQRLPSATPQRGHTGAQAPQPARSRALVWILLGVAVVILVVLASAR